MKTTLSLRLCLMSLLCCALLHGQSTMQEKIIETKFLLGSDINESQNKEKLLEKLDEIKASVDEKYQQLHRLGHSRERLRQYKKNLEELSFDILELSCTQIGEAMKKGDAGRQLLEESRLKGRLLHFFKGLEMDDSLSFPEDKPSRDLYASFRSLSESLQTQEILAAFLNTESEECFFKDSLQVDSMKGILSGAVMNSAQEALRDAMHKEYTEIQQQQSGLEQEIGFLKNIKRKIQDRIQEEANVDLVSIFMGLPLFCLTIVLLFLGPGWIQSKYGSAALNPLLEKSQSIQLDLSTVLLLTMSVLILGLSGNINGDVLGTLIGGISGYVLNKVKS